MALPADDLAMILYFCKKVVVNYVSIFIKALIGPAPVAAPKNGK